MSRNRTTMVKERVPGVGIVRQYRFDGRIVTQVRARARGAFIMSAAPMQGRVVHRPAKAETLWLDGRYLGMTARTICGSWLSLVNSHHDAPEMFDLCERCLMEDFPGPCVYRLFDVGGNLLYVGCSVSLLSRLLSHIGGGVANSYGLNSWNRKIARWEYEVFPDHDSALHAEKLAILTERPLHNADLTDNARIPGRRRAAFAHLISDQMAVPR